MEISTRTIEKRPKRNPMTKNEKNTVLNIYTTLLKDNPNIQLKAIAIQTANVAGVSWGTVYKVIKEYKKTATLSSPKKRRVKKKFIDFIDPDTIYSIRKTIHKYFFKNEMPTIDKVLRDVNADEDLPNFKRTTFYKLLKIIGFKFSKRSRKSVLLEKDEIRTWRRNYLRTIKKYRQEERKIYFTDETWLNEGHTCSKVWKDTTITSKRQAYREGFSTGLKNPPGKGRRLIITHIGSDTGFFNDGLHTFISKSGKGDYHDEMNARVYEEWFESILEKVAPSSVIVIDNAPYHSRKSEKIPSSQPRS